MNKYKLFLLSILVLSLGYAYSTVVAFDLTKAETAGNADWTIGSSPNWTGAYSEWGVELRGAGYQTMTLTGSTLTAAMLANVDVLILPEPQNPFTAAERTVILNFVSAGGGLFLIADHDGSDRNNNGWDSRRVYNESLLTPANFGISFDANSLYADPTSLFENPRTQLTNGLASVGMYAGCSITPSNGAICHIWLRSNSEEGLVTKLHGQGKVAAYGDSSPFDDGTGNSGNELHDGWTDHSNAQMAMNIVDWLAGTTSESISFTNLTINPSAPLVNQPIQLSVHVQASNAISFAYLYWKTTGAFYPVSMSNTGNNVFTATIPAQSSSCLISYYIQIMTTNSIMAYYPAGAPANLLTITVSPVANADELATPVSLKCFPNPLQSGAELIIKANPDSKIDIYNARGQCIRHLSQNTGQAIWDGKDAQGAFCPAGIYLLKTIHHTQSKTHKILIVD
jgi:hypothetical protein